MFTHPDYFSLKSSGSRMESFDHKMSKSDPGGAILIHDDAKRLRKKMQKHAYLNTEDENSPIYELAEHVILPEFGEIIVTPNPKFGQPSTWTSVEEFRNAVMDDGTFILLMLSSVLLMEFQEDLKQLQSILMKIQNYLTKSIN